MLACTERRLCLWSRQFNRSGTVHHRIQTFRAGTLWPLHHRRLGNCKCAGSRDQSTSTADITHRGLCCRNRMIQLKTRKTWSKSDHFGEQTHIRTEPHVSRQKNSSRPHTNRERVTEQHKNNHISK